ncbi:Rasrelated protein Rab10like, partial [Caligus rogercresseyi]
LIQVLVACKCDTPPSQLQTLAINKKFYYFETDSKDNQGIKELFDDVTEKVLGLRERNHQHRCSEASSLADTRESSLEPPPRRGRSISPIPGGDNNPFA